MLSMNQCPPLNRLVFLILTLHPLDTVLLTIVWGLIKKKMAPSCRFFYPKGANGHSCFFEAKKTCLTIISKSTKETLNLRDTNI